MARFSLDLPWAVNRECALEVGKLVYLQKENFSGVEKWCARRLFGTNCNLVYLLEGVQRILVKKKWAGNRRKRRKRFYCEMWEGHFRNVGLRKLHGTLNVWWSYWNCWIHLGEYLVHVRLDFHTKLQKYTSFAYCWEGTKWNAAVASGDRMCKNLNPLQGLTLDGTTSCLLRWKNDAQSHISTRFFS